MKIYRELLIIPNKDGVRTAKFYRHNGDIYFKYDNEDDSKMERLADSDIAHKYTCAECKHCVDHSNTNNDAKVLKPFSPCSHSCDRWKNSDKYDIVFRMIGVGCGRKCVCNKFEPKCNLPKWNVNQFIDVKNSCDVPRYRYITGFSYKDDGVFKQIPFTFKVTIEDFENGIVRGNYITMYNPQYWTDGFNINGVKYKSLDNYILQHNITDEQTIHQIKHFNYKTDLESVMLFDLNKKWFR
jgi:hypothetical protein